MEKQKLKQREYQL